MFDIQHDSAVPIHEQINSQIMVHIASGALRTGALLAEYRAFAQELLTNPQVVARAYGDLEADGVLQKDSAGRMEVTTRASVICRTRMAEMARERIRQTIAFGVCCGLADDEIAKAVEQALAGAKAEPLTPKELLHAMKKPTHELSHRASQGIQDLSRKKGSG